ncbi:MFS transporter [Streptomyces antimycoticus]
MAFAESAGGGEPASSPESGPMPGMRSWVPLLAVCAGYFMVILDVTVINVAVPVIGRELSASLTGIKWITDGYTLVFAGFLLGGGALGDRLGNRRIFCTGVAVFTVSSAACAFAPSAPVLVDARVVEGLGAALIVPGSLALLQQAYPAAAARSLADYARGCAPAWPSVRSPTWPPRVSHGSAYRPSPRARRLIGRLAHPAERWPVLLRNVARAAARRRGSVAL